MYLIIQKHPQLYSIFNYLICGYCVSDVVHGRINTNNF